MSTDVSELRAASIIRAIIALLKEAARTCETSVDIQLRTRQYIPEDSELSAKNSAGSEKDKKILFSIGLFNIITNFRI
jgi:hypothetical protein